MKYFSKTYDEIGESRCVYFLTQIGVLVLKDILIVQTQTNDSFELTVLLK